jgi:hypothetical protein
VFIRAQRVKQQVLTDGDIIQIGEHRLLYRDMRGAAPHQAVAGDEDHELDDLDEDDDDRDDDDDDEDEDESDADELDEQEVDQRKL